MGFVWSKIILNNCGFCLGQSEIHRFLDSISRAKSRSVVSKNKTYNKGLIPFQNLWLWEKKKKENSGKNRPFS